MTLITMPSSPAFKTSEFGIRRTNVVQENPFTGSQQVFSYDRSQWYAVLELPRMSLSQAREWQSFFMQLEGRKNTFLLGDPDGKDANGTVTSASVAASASVGATSVNLTIGSGKTLNKGSYLSLGATTEKQLVMVVDNNTGDGTVTIQPPLKRAITTSTAVDITAPEGVFRMDSNDLTWSADEITFGISFSCSEAFIQ